MLVLKLPYVSNCWLVENFPSLTDFEVQVADLPLCIGYRLWNLWANNLFHMYAGSILIVLICMLNYTYFMRHKVGFVSITDLIF